MSSVEKFILGFVVGFWLICLFELFLDRARKSPPFTEKITYIPQGNKVFSASYIDWNGVRLSRRIINTWNFFLGKKFVGEVTRWDKFLEEVKLFESRRLGND